MKEFSSAGRIFSRFQLEAWNWFKVHIKKLIGFTFENQYNQFIDIEWHKLESFIMLNVHIH